MSDRPPRRRTRPARGAEVEIAGALARLESALARRPGFGRTTSRSTTENHAGLRCRTVEDVHRFATDLSPALGGTGGAPTPTALLRAALGGCMAMTYRLRAARHGVELGSIRVAVETDSMLAGMLLPDTGAPAGFIEVRCHVDIETGARAGQVARLVAEGDRLSPVLDALRGTRLETSLSINGTAH